MNYDAIEVSKASDIPCDYLGKMGVSITFMDKYNPEQFEILYGYMDSHGKVPKEIPNEAPYRNGKWLFSRIRPHIIEAISKLMVRRDAALT